MNKSTNTTVLVTGGLGSIGHVLCKELIKESHKVIIIDNLSIGREEFLDDLPEARFYKCDVADYNCLKKVFKENEIDAVIHLAAKHYIPYCEKHHKETIEANVFGTYNIILLMHEFNVPHIVFASTSSVYKPAERPYKETDELSPVNIYGSSKLMCENAVKQYASQTGMTYTILRFYNVYGPNDLVPHVIPELVKQAREFDTVKVGNLYSRRDFIKSKDIAAAIIESLKKEVAFNNVYNVGTGRALSIKEVCDELQRVTNKELKFEVADERKRDNDPLMLLADISKITKELDWRPDKRFSLEKVFNKTKFWPAT